MVASGSSRAGAQRTGLAKTIHEWPPTKLALEPYNDLKKEDIIRLIEKEEIKGQNGTHFHLLARDLMRQLKQPGSQGITKKSKKADLILRLKFLTQPLPSFQSLPMMTSLLHGKTVEVATAAPSDLGNEDLELKEAISSSSSSESEDFEEELAAPSFEAPASDRDLNEDDLFGSEDEEDLDVNNLFGSDDEDIAKLGGNVDTDTDFEDLANISDSDCEELCGNAEADPFETFHSTATVTEVISSESDGEEVAL